MAAEIIEIANAVVVEINAHTFAAPFDATLNAERRYDADFKLTDLTDLKVTVVAASLAGVLASRGKARDMRYEIDVAVQQKLSLPVDDPVTQADLNNLLALVEEMADFLFQMPNLPGLAAAAVALENTPIYDPERLKFGHFLSALTLTFQVFR